MFTKSFRTSDRTVSGRKIILPAVLLLASQTMTSYADTAAYEMVVYQTNAQGRLLSEGEYYRAKAISNGVRAGSFDAANNQCVLKTLAQEFDQASEVCEQAVKLAADETIQGSLWAATRKSGMPDIDAHAMALSNRGVLRALTGDLPGAEVDFELAAGLDSKITAPETNLMLLESKKLSAGKLAHAGD